MKKIIFTFLSASICVVASPNVPVTKFKNMLIEQAGEDGPFMKVEHFPKDYFLISKNLPFLAGATLHHPQSSSLNLTQRQIDELLKIKKTTMPNVIKLSKKIKSLELQVAKEIGLKHKSKKAEDLYVIIDEIADLKSQLSKAHLKCMENVKAVLSTKQYEKALEYLVINK